MISFSDRIANDLPSNACACDHPACLACRDRRAANVAAGYRQAAEHKAQCLRDVETFQATGELPPAWAPEECARCLACAVCPEHDDAKFDARVDEMNRELELEREQIESGSVEPPRFGWSIARAGRVRCTCADGNMAECRRHGL